MKYKKLMLIVYNDEPSGPLPFGDDCYHVELDLSKVKGGGDNYELLMDDMRSVVLCAHHAMVPPIPHYRGGKYFSEDTEAVNAWTERYHCRPCRSI